MPNFIEIIRAIKKVLLRVSLENRRNNRLDMISFVPGFGCDHGGVK